MSLRVWCLWMSSPFTRCVFYPMQYQKAMFIVRRIFVLSNLFQLAATDSNRPTNCMRFSGTRSQTFHSMTSSAITKSGSSSRLSHRVVNTVASDDAVDISVQTDQEQLPQPIQIEPQGNHITIGVPHSPRMHANLPCVCVCVLFFWSLFFILLFFRTFTHHSHSHPHPFFHTLPRCVTEQMATGGFWNCHTTEIHIRIKLNQKKNSLSQFNSTGNAQLTISAVIDAAKEVPCCSRTLSETNQLHAETIEAAPPASIVTPMDGTTVAAVVTKSNGHKSISTTENTHNTDATTEGISRVSSSNSVHNPNRKSSINLEPGFIETIMDDYTRKTN